MSRDLTVDRMRWVVYRDPVRLTEFRAEYGVSTAPLAADAGEEIVLPVTVTNTGNERWIPYGRGPDSGLAVHLSYRYTPVDGSTATLEGVRTHLGEVVSPGETVKIPLRIVAPAKPGDTE